MNTLALCLAAALIGTISAEPPSGYSYSRPSGGGGGGGGGYYSGGGGGGGGGGGFFGGGGGGNLISVAPGPSTSEGQYVEPQLLEKIRQLLLQEESNAAASGGGGGGGGGYPSSQYGAPSTQYGVPSYQTRVVGVDLEGVRQAIQVAQYQQTSVGASTGGGYNYPSAPSRPTGSYGAPF